MEQERIIKIPTKDGKEMLTLHFLYQFYEKITNQLTGKTYVIEAKFYYDLSENSNGFHPMYFTRIEDSGRIVLELTGQYFRPSDRPQSAANHRKEIRKMNNQLSVN